MCGLVGMMKDKIRDIICNIVFLFYFLDPAEVGEDMVNKALEVLAILSYHPVVREALIAHDVLVFVRLFKKYVMSRNGANRDLLLEIFSSIVKQEPVLTLNVQL